MTLNEEIQQKKNELREAFQECLEAERVLQAAQQIRASVFKALDEGSTTPLDGLLTLQRYAERLETARDKALRFDEIAEELVRLQERKAAGFG
jgi:hypothetical protein